MQIYCSVLYFWGQYAVNGRRYCESPLRCRSTTFVGSFSVCKFTLLRLQSSEVRRPSAVEKGESRANDDMAIEAKTVPGGDRVLKVEEHERHSGIVYHQNRGKNTQEVVDPFRHRGFFASGGEQERADICARKSRCRGDETA